MPENMTQEPEESKETPGTTAENAEKTFTQSQVDEIVKQRLARAKHEKPADYDELKQKAERYDQAMTESESNLSKLQARIDALEGENKEMKHQKEIASWRDDVANKTGVPASVLRGDTKEDIEAHAQAIKDALSAYPTVNPGKPAPQKMTREQVDAITDPIARVKARAKLIEDDE